jgi:hypothetical protein
MPTIPLTAEGFREKVFDYTKDQEWQYNGSLPAIMTFMQTGAVPARQWLLCWKNYLPNMKDVC